MLVWSVTANTVPDELAFVLEGDKALGAGRGTPGTSWDVVASAKV